MSMKSLFPLVLMLLIAINSFSQEALLEKQVPQVVKKAFVDKFPEVTSADWFKNNDSVIGVKFSFNKKKTAAAFKTSGAFVSSSSEIAPKEMPGMISNYIRGNHRNYVVSLSMVTEDAKGVTSYYVEIKNPGVAQAVTQLYFDFYGKLTKIIEPQEAKLERDKDKDTDDDLGADVASGQEIGKKELPSTVNTYLESNYKAYRFDKAIFVDNKEHGRLYEIKMRKIGYRDFILVHFDLLGKFVELEQPK